jgi:hypothetical protein
MKRGISLVVLFALVLVLNLIIVWAGTLKVTSEHPFLVNSQWIAASELKVGDKLVTSDGKTATIKRITWHPEEVSVFNLEDEFYHNYIVTGDELIVHNSNPIQSCFSAETRIRMADGSEKEIKNVKNGEEVLSWDISLNTSVTGKVIRTWHGEHDDIYLINNMIKVTSEHPFWTFEKGWAAINSSETLMRHDWKPANLMTGYNFMDSGGKKVLVSSIKKLDEKIMTYNLEIEQYGNYFAGGVLVHNKANYVGNRRLEAGDKVSFKVDGKDKIGFVEDILPDGHVRVKFDINRPDTFSVGDKVAVPRDGNNWWSEGVVSEVRPDGNLKIDVDDGANYKVFDPARVFKMSGTSKHIILGKEKITVLDDTRTMQDMIDNAVKNREIVVTDPLPMNEKLDPSSPLRIENARTDFMYEVRPGGKTEFSGGLSLWAKTVVPIPFDGLVTSREKWLWILTDKGIMRIARKCSTPKELGIKHLQLSRGEGVVYAGEMIRLRDGTLAVDLQSGTFSRGGLNLQYDLTQMANRDNLMNFLREMLPPTEKIKVFESTPGPLKN